MLVIFLVLLPIDDTCPECLRYLKWLENCFNWTAGIAFYVRIVGAKLAMPHLYHYLFASVPWVHCLLLEYLLSLLSLRADLSLPFYLSPSMSSPLESCKDSFFLCVCFFVLLLFLWGSTRARNSQAFFQAFWIFIRVLHYLCLYCQSPGSSV